MTKWFARAGKMARSPESKSNSDIMARKERLLFAFYSLLPLAFEQV